MSVVVVVQALGDLVDMKEAQRDTDRVLDLLYSTKVRHSQHHSAKYAPVQAGGGSASGGSLAGGVVVLLCPQDLSIDSLAPTGKKLSSVKGALEFKNIHFRYPARSDSEQSWSNFLGPSARLPASQPV